MKSNQYRLFQKLCAALEIREDSSADRDRGLYSALRKQLGMGTQSPRAFFEVNPSKTEAEILVAFLDTFEPFARMLEEVFLLCAEAPRGAAGGNDLEIRFDETAKSLRFDLDGFKRFRAVLRRVRAPTLIPRFHTDFLPGYGSMMNIFDGRVRNEEVGPPVPTADELDVQLQALREIGGCHQELLDDYHMTFGDGEPEEEALATWIAEHDVPGDYTPRPYHMEMWRGAIPRGLTALQNVDGASLHARHDSQTLAGISTVLQRLIDELAVRQERESWRRNWEEWLKLPYWKKRWQLYEAWVFCTVLRALTDAGGRLCPDEDGVLVLRTAASSMPKGVISAGPLALEVWFEFELDGGALRPDIGISVAFRESRLPLAFIEVKQRAGVTANAMLADAAKYLPHFPNGSQSLVVNYDPWGGDASLLDQGRTVKAVGSVSPEAIGYPVFMGFLGEVFSVEETVCVLVVDTTGSMGTYLPQIAEYARSLELSGVESGFLLYLYGDHDDVYTVRLHAEVPDAQGIARALEDPPRTDGGDEPEALEDALHQVFEESVERSLHVARLLVFTDAPAHPPDECPRGFDVREELARFIDTGTKVTLIACEPAAHTSAWDGLSGASVVGLESR